MFTGTDQNSIIFLTGPLYNVNHEPAEIRHQLRVINSLTIVYPVKVYPVVTRSIINRCQQSYLAAVYGRLLFYFRETHHLMDRIIITDQEHENSFLS